MPDEAILTTFFVKSAPEKVTAYSGMDVLVHALESLVAKKANHFTDALAEKAIELVVENLPTCVVDGKNEVARAAMHEASCMAGIAFNQAGLGDYPRIVTSTRRTISCSSWTSQCDASALCNNV